MRDENTLEFNTYFPIQLDATCNGFQHLAMLANEDTLFKELNLINSTDQVNDFYSFLIHKLDLKFDYEIHQPDNKYYDNYKRLKDFVIVRGLIKKLVMTIPYNVGITNMKKYFIGELFEVSNNDKKGTNWYSKQENEVRPWLCDKDISLLVSAIHSIVTKDFEKIKKLRSYLKSVAIVFSVINLPIIWYKDDGLVVIQGYLEEKSCSIRPYLYSNTKLNIRVLNKDKFNSNKQIRSLMPNLIHSLDSVSLSLLYDKFYNVYKPVVQFYSIHDCFSTTIDKVDTLKTLLASVYMDIYSKDSYLDKFNNSIWNQIEQSGIEYDRKNRTIKLELSDEENKTKTYTIHDIEWVKSNKNVSKYIINKIDSQHILV